MSNDTQYPHSVPTTLRGQLQDGFQGGKNKVLQLFNTLHLVDFLKQFTQQVLPLESAKWFALDCAKLVLPRFEEWLPNDKRVRDCIEVGESYLNGKSNLKELSIAAPDARGVYYAAYSARYAASAGANSAYAASSPAVYAVHYAGLSAAFAGKAISIDNPAGDIFSASSAASSAALDATSKDEMQGFIKNWIDQYFNI